MKGRISHKEYWEDVAKKPAVECKAWSNRYIGKAQNGSRLVILDIGCGRGLETEYCLLAGHKVVSADLAQGMIDHVRLTVPGSNGIVFDMENDDWKVFKANQFDVVIASLCLHYFDDETTVRIIKEIQRVLKPNGKLYARVNSINDFVHGAGNGVEIQKNFYIDKERGITKRYFDESDVQRFFKPLGEIKYQELKVKYFGTLKVVFEVIVNKKPTM